MIDLKVLDILTSCFLMSVKDGPGDLSWVLLALEQLLGFAVDEDDLLAIGLDVGLTVAWIDFQTGKVANFGSHGECYKQKF